MKKYLPIIILIVLLFGLSSSALAYPTIVQDYPLLKACENNTECKPGQTGFGLPQYIKYIFIFALGTVGIIGLLAIIMAAFDYVKSVGNPQKAAAGKDKITSALLGLLLLLASYVLLNLVNPDLLKLKIKEAPVKVTVSTDIEVTVSTDIEECKKECAAQGPPSPACLQECEETPETRCHYGTANLKPTPLDFAGGQYKQTFTLTKVNCTAEETMQNDVFFDLRQVNPGIVNPDPQYREVINNGELIKNTDTEWAVEWTYVTIFNLLENQPEQFYLTGEIKIPHKPSQYIPKINFDVIDGR